ncbi:MAG: NAD(P)H-dependent oxidoreductase [Acidobacteria bacterium]|nr:NAD(P)H-dependent oxidoreductase [Acidobacteriota bacterium]
MTDSTLHVLAISGSLRRGSYNTALLRAAADMAPQSMKIDIYPIGDLPLYDADLEAAGNPDPVTRFREAVAEADALLLATPEYNWSTTAALKNAIDWASRGGVEAPLNHKPAAILGAGGRFGTLRAQLHLREILSHNQVRLVEHPQVHVSMAADKFDSDGRLEHERTIDQLGRLLVALEDLARA